jgi:uncharacterized protein (TIGR03437 family)
VQHYKRADRHDTIAPARTHPDTNGNTSSETRGEILRVRPFTCVSLVFWGAATTLSASGVTVVFDPGNPASGPYPSDVLTVTDAAQKTGRRINLPRPDCTVDSLGCILQPALNQFDGFNLQPRIRVRFSAAINPDTLKGGIFYVTLDNLTTDEAGVTKTGDVIAINEIVYDPSTFTAFAKPDSFLDQHRRYALVVTTAVKDTNGDPVGASAAYKTCQSNSSVPNCPANADLAVVTGSGTALSAQAAVTVFTTASATAWLERARDGLVNTSPGFMPGPVVDLASYPVAVWHQQTGIASFTDTPLPFSLLQSISRIAFGTYLSPNYLNASQTIGMPPTGQPLAPAGRTERIQFNAFVPAGSKPATGYPVVIVGHGLGSDRFSSPGAIASTFAAAGWAVVAIDAVGHGLGQRSSVLFSGAGGQFEVPAPGRGVSQSATGAIAPGDGCVVLIPLPVGGRDCILQTTVDLLQLARVLRAGVDLDGDGSVDLDPARVAYLGHSLGSQYGAVFMATDPNIAVSALASAGGTTVAINRMSPSFIPSIAQYLGAVERSLLNAGTGFNGNWPFRDEPVRVNSVSGAIDLQEAFEKVEWLSAPGEGLNFATHLKSSPLAGVPAKKVLWQFPIGDRTSPNPSETALVRASSMLATTRIYRADLAYAANPALPINPHSYILDISTAANVPVALAAQSQLAGFIASGGILISDPSASLAKAFGIPNLFEAPAVLPETLNFFNFPVPVLSALSVSGVGAGSAGFIFSVTGAGFASGSVVLWNGLPRPTAFSSPTRLSVTIPASDLTNAGSAQISVVNPTPGGGTSASVVFTIATAPPTPAPNVSPGGVVNSATFSASSATAGSIASVFGNGLASSSEVASALPLPNSLGGVTVLVNGNAVPLFAVSPQQINFQVPWYLEGTQTATLNIVNNGVSGNSVTFSLSSGAPALFSLNQQGSGQGVVLIGGTGSIAALVGTVSGSRPAQRGEYVSIYCTGLGPVVAQPGSGRTPAGGGSPTRVIPTVSVGGIPATVSWAGLAPSMVGIYQVNVQVPSAVTVSAAVPVSLSINGIASNQVTIAVQ